jgi:hypothetical protein
MMGSVSDDNITANSMPRAELAKNRQELEDSRAATYFIIAVYNAISYLNRSEFQQTGRLSD